jgi:hypothetical protein
MDGSHFISGPFDRSDALQTQELPNGRTASLFLRRDLSVQALRLPAEPSFGPTDLAAARQSGFEAGHAAASAEAARSHAQAQALALGVIARAMTDSQAEAAHVADRAAGSVAQALVAALRAVMPDLIARAALGETGAMLAAILPGLSRELTIRVEVPGTIAKGIAATVAGLAAEHRDRIEVRCPDGLAAGEARVSWASGQAVRQPAEVWLAVMDLLEPALGEPSMKDHVNGQ